MDISVQYATANDENDWRRLWRAYLTFYKTTLNEEAYASAWDRIQDETEEMYSLLAFSGTKAVGLCNFLYHSSFWEPEPRCYLNDLYVDPDVRGGGAGRKLIAETVAHSKNKGAACVYWTTANDNKEARTLYDKVATLTPFIKYQVK